jgi:hypothetical protein
MNNNYNSWSLLAGLLTVMLLSGCASGSGNAASRDGCCQVSSRQCTDSSRAQCNGVQGTYHDGKECNGSTHQCE